jgi:2-methylcitrate dehydratase PrpD
MDQMGIAVAGRALFGEHPASRLAARFVAPLGASLWTSEGRVLAPYAALVNRAIGDEMELAAGPECVAAAVAACEIAGATVGDLLDAIVVAADIEEYFRSWLGPPLERHGLHPPAVLGAIAAAAAAARALDLDANAFAAALTSAAALAPPSPYAAFSRGVSGKTLYGAWSQMLGLSAAMWSTAGMAGPLSVMEGSRGVAQAIVDAGGAVMPPPFEPDGKAITRVAFKAFPCNRACHAPLTALADIQREGPLDPRDVERIDVWTYPYAVALDRRSRGTSRIALQMSVRATLALALLGRDLLSEPVGEAGFLDAAASDLADRIVVRVDPALSEGGARVRSAQLAIRLKSGRRLEARALPKWGLQAPATDADLRARFLTLAGGAPALDPWTWPEDRAVRLMTGPVRS